MEEDAFDSLLAESDHSVEDIWAEHTVDKIQQREAEA